MAPKPLYVELAQLVQARKNCLASFKATGVDTGWFDRHSQRIENLVSEHMPSGSGFDNGTRIMIEGSHAEKLVFTTSFHHMDEVGGYDGWTEHTVTVTPSFGGFNLRITGRNRNDIKENIHVMFDEALKLSV